MKFREITLQDKELYEKYITNNGYTTVCTSFTSAYIWSANGLGEIAEDDDAIYIRMHYEGKTKYYAPYMKDRTADISPAIDKLRELSPEGILIQDESIKDHICRCYKKPARIEDDRDYFEYIYRTSDLIELKGKKYHGKRNHINTYLASHSIEYAEYTPDMFEECMELAAIWAEGQTEDITMIEAEREGLRRFLTYYDVLNAKACVIKENGKICAFSGGSEVTPEIAGIHFEKCHPDYRGLYPVINNEFLKRAWKDYTFVNREEDMGHVGLRKAKLSYRPEFYCKKHELHFGTIKEISASDYPDAKEIWKLSFGDDKQYIDDVFNYRIPKSRSYGVYEKNKLVSMVFVDIKKTYSDGEEIKSAFMYGVATHPNYRSGRYSSRLIEAVCSELKEKGIAVQLSTYIPSFYERLGFVSYSRQYLCKVLEKPGQEYKTATFNPLEVNVNALVECYKKFAETNDGCFVRDEYEMRLRLREANRVSVVYYCNDIVAYALIADNFAYETVSLCNEFLYALASIKDGCDSYVLCGTPNGVVAEKKMSFQMTLGDSNFIANLDEY